MQRKGIAIVVVEEIGLSENFGQREETRRCDLCPSASKASARRPGGLSDAVFVEEQMAKDVFEVTPMAALSATTALFLELAALLHKRGSISAVELGRNLLAASAEAGADSNVRCVVSALRNVGQSLVDGFRDAP